MHASGDFVSVTSIAQPAAIWDVRTGAPWAGVEIGERYAAWSASGSMLAYCDGNESIQVCEFPAGTPIRRFKAQRRNTNLLFSPDDRWLAAAHDRKVNFYSLEKPTKETITWSSSFDVFSLAFSEDSSRLSAAGEGRLGLFSLDEQREIPLKSVQYHHSSDSFLTDPRSAPTKPPIVVGDTLFSYYWRTRTKYLSVVDLDTDTLKKRLAADQPGVLDVSNDGRFVAYSYKNRPWIWDVSRQEYSSSAMTGHQHLVASAKFGGSVDLPMMVTGSLDGTARVWRLSDGQMIGQPMMHQGYVTHVAFQRNRIATLQDDGLLHSSDAPASCVRAAPACRC